MHASWDLMKNPNIKVKYLLICAKWTTERQQWQQASTSHAQISRFHTVYNQQQHDETTIVLIHTLWLIYRTASHFLSTVVNYKPIKAQRLDVCGKTAVHCVMLFHPGSIWQSEPGRERRTESCIKKLHVVVQEWMEPVRKWVGGIGGTTLPSAASAAAVHTTERGLSKDSGMLVVAGRCWFQE